MEYVVFVLQFNSTIIKYVFVIEFIVHISAVISYVCVIQNIF